MAKLSQEVKEAIKEMSFPHLSKREENKVIIYSVKAKFNVLIDSNDIYEIKTRTRKLREAIDELNNAVSEEKLYEVKKGNYEFVQDKLLYKIPVEEIDAMFYDFSKHWGNMSGEAMLAKYELKPNVWHMIKNRLRLYKDSNVISPYTAENTPEEQLDDVVTEATHRHIDTIKNKMVKTHEKEYGELAKKAISRMANMDYFLSNVERIVSTYEPKNIQFVPERLPKGIYPPITIAISDFHFGKAGTSEIVERMLKIAQYIISQPNTEVQILSLGDLAEAFVEGGMHPWQEAWMELTGYDLMMYIVNVFENFLLEIYKSGKSVTFRGIGGNHDRLGKTHSDDQKRSWALIVYELIKRWLSKFEIEIEILRESVNAFDYGPNRFIIAHWDDNFTNRLSEKTLWTHWDNKKHNVILSGDKHNAKLAEVYNATNVSCPALAWAWDYDKRLNLHSESGFVVIEPNIEWSVDVMLRRLR